MSEADGVYTVLIVDDDLGFALWLSELFVALRAVNVIPAPNSDDALAMTTKLKLKVDLLLVNPSLSGVEGLIKSLKRRRSNLKIVLIGDDITVQSQKIPHDAILAHPHSYEPVSWPDWLRRLRRLLTRLGFDGSKYLHEVHAKLREL